MSDQVIRTTVMGTRIMGMAMATILPMVTVMGTILPMATDTADIQAITVAIGAMDGG